MGPTGASCGAEAPADATRCAACGAALGWRVADGGEPGGADELRPVTALFADIVGSTGLGEQLNPDEVKALVGECVTRMSQVVERFGGTVQAYMGDGICAYFGVPTAHEDDADRAAEAALELLTTVAAYGRDVRQAWGIEEFDVRIGINGGLAAVGTVGAAQPQPVALGDMTNVAARLQGSAAPGTIVAGESTAQRLMPRFVLEQIGELTLKGRAAPVTAWRVLRRKTSSVDRSLAPLVGREIEADRLRHTADDLIAGRGQSLLLVGDAGIGKSRLLAELHDRAGDGVTWLEGDCRSYGAAGLYWPFVQMMRAWLGVEPADREIVVRMRMRARLPALYDDPPADPLFFLGHLLSVQPDADERERIRDTSADDLSAGIRAAFCEWIMRLAVRAPVAVAIEGLHEADASTCQMLEDLLDLTDRAPVLVVMTSRPERDTVAWRFRAHALTQFAHRFEEITLEPIAPEAAAQLLDVIAPGVLDPASRHELVSRAEGNPLYLEEMAHALEHKEFRPHAWTVTAGTAAPLPPTLDTLLIARFDRLDADARALGQTAAVIGREFPARVLERVAGSQRYQAGLPGLLRSGVIREARRYPELEYSFRHGLLQEAARGTLTQARRADLCGRLAEVFEELFADSLDERLEMLAHYHAQSGNLPRALEYLERAGDRAADWGQPDLAATLWRRALRVATALGNETAVAALVERLGDDELPEQLDTGDLPEPPAEPAPARIGPYLLEGPLPPLATTVRASAPDEGLVALRLVGRSEDDDGEWQQLRAAAAAAARVDDSHLVPGLAAGEADGWRYLVMAWCDGGSLADRLADGAGVSIEHTVQTMVRAALGLDALHRAGLVHGGVRPQSVLFDGEGRARLAPVATSPPAAALPGRAPEVAAGGDVTPAAEIYELASVAAACLDAAGAPAPADLLWSVEQGRAADPARRPGTAAMFAQMLRMAVRTPAPH